MWMSVSGILLNHPELISGRSVPGWLVPAQYHIRNWDRSALIELIYSRHHPRLAFAAGKKGVWKTLDGGRNFQPLNNGFPASEYYRKTNDIFLWESEQKSFLLAATDGGLYAYNLQEKVWKHVLLPGETERVLKILKVKNKLVVFSTSHAYLSAVPEAGLNFHRLPLRRTEAFQTVSLVRLFFDLHHGGAWNLPGRLLYDFTGLVLIFLSLAAFYIWYFPWKRKRPNREKDHHPSKIKQFLFRKSHKYHLKLGIWFAAILLIMGGTAFFMRPPTLAIIANRFLPVNWYPGPLPDNPWDQKIQNALYDAVEDRIIIQATDGFWVGPPDFKKPFVKKELGAPVFVMGATVFEPYGTGGFLVGSFSGIFHLERQTGRAINILNNREAKNISPVRPADNMVTGYFKTPQGEEFITTHRNGLLPVGSAKLNGRFKMPEKLETSYRMPLWNFMFELHNGRIFQDLIGGFYILLVPLGSLLFVLVTLSGVYDWLYVKILRKKFY